MDEIIRPGTPGFSANEIELLNKYGKFYEDLESGKSKPRTSAQEHFVRMCKGQVAAETAHEKAYRKYIYMKCINKNEAKTPLDNEKPTSISKNEDNVISDSHRNKNHKVKHQEKTYMFTVTSPGGKIVRVIYISAANRATARKQIKHYYPGWRIGGEYARMPD